MNKQIEFHTLSGYILVVTDVEIINNAIRMLMFIRKRPNGIKTGITVHGKLIRVI